MFSILFATLILEIAMATIGRKLGYL